VPWPTAHAGAISPLKRAKFFVCSVLPRLKPWPVTQQPSPPGPDPHDVGRGEGLPPRLPADRPTGSSAAGVSRRVDVQLERQGLCCGPVAQQPAGVKPGACPASDGSPSGWACLPAGRLQAVGGEMCTGFRRYTGHERCKLFIDKGLRRQGAGGAPGRQVHSRYTYADYPACRQAGPILGMVEQPGAAPRGQRRPRPCPAGGSVFPVARLPGGLGAAHWAAGEARTRLSGPRW